MTIENTKLEVIIVIDKENIFLDFNYDIFLFLFSSFLCNINEYKKSFIQRSSIAKVNIKIKFSSLLS